MRLVEALRPFSRKFNAPFRAGRRNLVEALESRTLLNATLTGAISPISATAGSSPTNINLGTHFNDPTVPGTAVALATGQGTIDLALLDTKTPKTVANFLHYVNTGEYNGTVFQRADPGFVLQGGGFTANQTHIATTGQTLQSEAGVSNTTGTVAMALSTGPTSATSDFFINLTNNSFLDQSSSGGPFTVFANVIYNGMQVANTIVNLPKGSVPPTFVPNTSAGDPAGGTLPLQNYTQGAQITTANYVTITASVVPALTYTATSDNPSLVAPTVSASNLGLTYGSGTGTAHVTVTATDLGGNVATSTFAVTVGAASNTITIGKGAAAKLVRFTDPDGTISEVRINGAGTATLSFQGTVTTATSKSGIATVTGTPTSVSLSTTGTDKSTDVTITGKGGNGVVDLAGITTDAAVHSITGRNTALTGNVQAAGGLANLTLNSANNGIIGVGSGATALNLKIDSGQNESVTSGQTISNLTAGSWGAGASIHAPTITHANIRNAFAADVSTTDIGTFQVGSLTGGTWNVSNLTGTVTARTANGWAANFKTLATLRVAGAFDNSTVNASGNIDTVTAGSMNGSKVYTGVASTVATLPASGADFSAPNSLNTFHVSRTFANSDVAAGSLGRISAGGIQVANNGTPFGFASGAILTFDARVSGRHVHLHRITTQSGVNTAVTKQGAALQDLAIRIV